MLIASKQNKSRTGLKEKMTHTVVAIEEERLQYNPDSVWKCLFPLMAFLSIIVQSRLMAIVIAIAFVLFSVGKVPVARLRGRITPLTLFVMLYAVLCLAAGLYSDFGASAAKDSAKILSAFALFSMVLVRTKNGGERQVLTVIVIISAIISFLCIDASCYKLFTKAFATIMKLFLYDCNIELMGYEQGIRVTGIFCNANVSAGIIAFGVLIGLYLIKTASTKKKRFGAFVALGINALGFLLSFSMGAIVAFMLACIMYLIAAGKGNRFPMLFLMIETVLVTVIFSFIAIPFLGTSGIISIIPLFCALICGPAVWGLDCLTGQRILNATIVKGKTIWIVCGALSAVVVVYVVLAINVTNAANLTSGEQLSRAEYLASGEYSVSAECVGAMDVLVYSQNEAQLMMHTNTVLYTGTPDNAIFTVPDDSRIVWFTMIAKDDTRLKKISLSDGTLLKLNYTMLPEIVANRLQGLLANQNFIQRLVFFEDGIKLFKQSPVIGSGLGAVEGRLTSVQSFYYESVYIHNHFIQVMDEMGLVGLIAFVMMILSTLILLWKERKTQREPILYAAFSACVVMMIAHSITEVVWSTGMYQSVVFLIFAVLIISYGKPMKRFESKESGRFTAIVLSAIMLCFGAMIGGNLLAANQVLKFKPTNREEVISTMRKLDLMDVYDDEFYKATYIQNALLADNYKEQMTATKYALQLRAADEYRACTDAAMYYFLPKGMIDAMFDASRAAIAQEASSMVSWNLQLDFYKQSLAYFTEKHMTKYLKGVTSTLDYLENYNKGRTEEIHITEQNQPFVDCIKKLADSDASDKEIYEVLSMFSK